MIFLNNLNEATYQQIKKDRQILLDRINASKALLDEFDLVFPILNSVFDPEIKIILRDWNGVKMYEGRVNIIQPNNQPKRRLVFIIGKEKEYSGLDDENLLGDAMKKAMKKIKKEFPQYF